MSWFSFLVVRKKSKKDIEQDGHVLICQTSSGHGAFARDKSRPNSDGINVYTAVANVRPEFSRRVLENSEMNANNKIHETSPRGEERRGKKKKKMIKNQPLPGLRRENFSVDLDRSVTKRITYKLISRRGGRVPYLRPH